MSYIQQTLLPSETVIYSTRKHWVIFLAPFLLTLISIVLSLQKDTVIVFSYVFLAMAFYYWLKTMTSYITSEYAVTNKRVLIKIGFIQRQTWETLLSKIATLEVQQSILGRLLNYGTLVIQSTGGGKDIFAIINNPLLFRRTVQQETEKMQVNL